MSRMFTGSEAKRASSAYGSLGREIRSTVLYGRVVPSRNEEAWTTRIAKLLREDPTAISATAVNAMLASATELKDGSFLPWDPNYSFTPQVFFDVIGCRSAPPGLGKLRTTICAPAVFSTPREELGRGMTACWRRIADDLNAFPPEVWQFFL